MIYIIITSLILLYINIVIFNLVVSTRIIHFLKENDFYNNINIFSIPTTVFLISVFLSYNKNDLLYNNNYRITENIYYISKHNHSLYKDIDIPKIIEILNFNHHIDNTFIQREHYKTIENKSIIRYNARNVYDVKETLLDIINSSNYDKKLDAVIFINRCYHNTKIYTDTNLKVI